MAAIFSSSIQIIKLEQEYISAYTSNQNPKYAKAGDTLDITFTANDTLAYHTSQILGLDANVIVNDAVYNAMVTVPSTPMESYATFTINVANAHGTSVTITENNISSSNVFIDTIPPSIELIGSADYTILSGTPSSSIPNVTVSDGDPNYVGNFTLVINDTVDTTRIGNVYNYTYTAYPDTAGNPGSSTSRIVTVMNPPFEIIPKLAVSPFGVIQNGMNGFNSIGYPQIINTFKIDNFAYAGVFGLNSNYFTIINITDPSSPSQVSVLDPTVNSLYTITDAAYTVIDGSTYALAISHFHDRVLIINVSNPSLPSLVTYIPDGADYTTLDGPYSIVTVKIDSSTFALATAFYDHGVQIIDITDPSNPIPASAITDGEDGYTKLRYTYDITTVTINSSTYALVTSFLDHGVQIIDITDPYNPIAASAITNGTDNYTRLGYPYDITAVTINSSTFALVATFSASDNGIQIIDITDPYNPIAASAITNGEDGYPNLGGLSGITAVTIGTSIFALVAASNDSTVQIIDITDPYNPTPEFAITNDKDGYAALFGASSITTVTTDSSTFALVTAIQSSSIQIIKLDYEYISAYTSNQNPKYAKAGDTLDITFTANDTIASHTSQILGLDANVIVNDAVYNAMVTVPSTPMESYATFTINVTNAQGTSAIITENNISSSNVFIDTMPPSIELIGSADYTVLPGTADPFIPNVTVSDGDPNYVGGFTLVKNDTVNTSKIPRSCRKSWS